MIYHIKFVFRDCRACCIFKERPCLQTVSVFASFLANYMPKELSACTSIETFRYTRSTIRYTIFRKYYIAIQITNP